MQNLALKNDPDIVNVYFVRAIAADTVGVPAASTIRSLRSIVVSDAVVPGDKQLTHEMGHCFLLLDAQDPDNVKMTPVIEGTINNVMPLFGPGTPSFKHYLMYGFAGHSDWLLNESEAHFARNILMVNKRSYGLVTD